MKKFFVSVFGGLHMCVRCSRFYRLFRRDGANPERVAGYIADATGGDVFELVPVEPYTDADLNWGNSDSRVVREHE